MSRLALVIPAVLVAACSCAKPGPKPRVVEPPPLTVPVVDVEPGKPLSGLDLSFLRAAIDGQWDRVKALLEQGASVNAAGDSGLTAL